MSAVWRTPFIWVSSAFLAKSFLHPGCTYPCYHPFATTIRRVFATSSSDNGFPLVVKLRNATTEDLDMILRWDEKPHLKDPDVTGDEEYNDWNWAVALTEEISWRYQLIAEVDDSIPIGVIQIIDPMLEESHYWGNDCPPNLRAIDIWIGEEDYLGQGYGTEMMRLALEEYCFVDPAVDAVVVDPMAANPRAHRFYQKCGFVPDKETLIFGLDECLVHRLSRERYNGADK